MKTLVRRYLAQLLRRRGSLALRRYLQATNEIAKTFQEAEAIAPSLKRLRRHGRACAILARRYRLEGVRP